MPVLKDIRQTVKLILPSFPDSEVEIYQGLLFGQMKDLEKFPTDIQRGVETLRLMIKDWNFTDEEGKKLEITTENLSLFPIEDLAFLLKEVGKYFAEVVKKNRKNSKV